MNIPPQEEACLSEEDFIDGHLSKEELIQAAFKITGGNVEHMSSIEIMKLMTVTQHVTDLCLNEIELRGAFREGIVVPYMSDYMVETILTRGYEHRPAPDDFAPLLPKAAGPNNRPGKPKGPAFTPRKAKKGRGQKDLISAGGCVRP